LFLREDLTTGGIIGIVMIVSGMIVIGTTSLVQARGSRVHLKGIFTALTVASSSRSTPL